MSYRAYSWSHDAWALIALIAFFVRHIGARFTMEIYGLMLGFGTFDTCNSRSEGTSKKQMLVMC